MNIGKAIKELRNAKKISQLALGLAIGNDSSYISRLENNQTEPSISTLLKIANALEIEPIVIFTLMLEKK